MLRSLVVTALLLPLVGQPQCLAQSLYKSFSVGEVEALQPHDGVKCVKLAPNSGTLLVGSDAGFQLCLGDSLIPKTSLASGHGGVVDAAFSYNSKLVATVGSERFISFWSAESGEHKATANEKRWAWTVDAHSNRLECVSSGGNPSVCKWDMVSGTLLQETKTDFDFVTALLILPGGNEFLCCGTKVGPNRRHNYTVELRDYRSFKLIRNIAKGRNQIYQLAISPDEARLAAVTQNGQGFVWDLKTWEIVSQATFDQEKTSQVSFLPDSRTLLVAGWHRKLLLWDTVTGENRKLAVPENGGLTCFVFLPKPNRIVLGSGLGETKLGVGKVSWSQEIAAQVQAPRTPTGKTGPGGRLAPPKGAMLVEARRKVAEAIDLSSAKTNELLEIVAQEGDSAVQYVLLEEARKLSAKEADQVLAEKVVSNLDSIFVVDRLTVAGSLIHDAIQAGIPRRVRAAWAAWSEKLGDEAELEEKIPFAKVFYRMAFDLRAQSTNPSGTKRIKEKRARMAEIEPQFLKARDALLQVQNGKADSAANTIAGKYFCFVRGDWGKGVPLLSIGDDKALASVALLDLKQAKNLSELHSLVEQWKRVSDSESDATFRSAAIQAARFWQKEILAKSTGLDKAAAKKRLGEFKSSAPERN